MWRRAVVLGGLAWVGAGCAAGSGAQVLGGSDAGGGDLEAGASQGASPGTPCETPGASQPCGCAASTGTQTCVSGAWSVCACGSGPGSQAEGGSGPIGNGSIGSGSNCKAGYYTGTFEGEYWSGLFDPCGIIGETCGSFVPVPVVAQGSGTSPGLGLTLEEQRTAVGEEFTIATVKDGCVIGTADAIGTQHPFVGVLTGEVDCDTGKFDGTLKGYYKLFGSDIIYPFEGPVSANYMENTLRDGMWDVDENVEVENSPGGMGSWSASWTGDVSDAPPLPEECMKLITGDAGTVAEGGVPPTTMDGGVAPAANGT